MTFAVCGVTEQEEVVKRLEARLGSWEASRSDVASKGEPTTVKHINPPIDAAQLT